MIKKHSKPKKKKTILCYGLEEHIDSTTQNLTKAKEVLLYLINQVGNKWYMFRPELATMLYYIDCDQLGLNYVKLKNGMMDVQEFDDLITMLVQEEAIAVVDIRSLRGHNASLPSSK